MLNHVDDTGTLVALTYSYHSILFQPVSYLLQFSCLFKVLFIIVSF
jgi:hypothetical protein